MDEILLLGLGNEILKDDGIGIYAARCLKEIFAGRIEIRESAESGLNLIDHISGYRKVLIIDSIKTERLKVGEILSFDIEELPQVFSSTPHYVGFPFSLTIARRFGIQLPEEIRVIAIEVEDPYTFQEGLSLRVNKILPEVVERAGEVLESWLSHSKCAQI
jgi:hydrogenase maturation protease